MNTKRQTIWLVSMLSLMVVLSAYYLFTQDLDDADKLSGTGTPTEDVSEASGNDGALVVDEVTQEEGAATEKLTDEEILAMVESQGYGENSVFSEIIAKRDQLYSEEESRLMAEVANVNNDPEQSAEAVAAIEQLEEKHSKIAELESALMKNYQIAMIDEENDRYKVVVASDKLEKKEAASIIDQVMTVMDVKAEQVSVQYVPEPQ
ncbi:SpoIIIAH-like family protein [Paenibacillus nanensis]|uniref:SpoIIIAH-like family protein n=1 Tax=Paenibacillus nanensis TaxID=393251 RepID=A0A3A1V461_9BACL|nr:SpoIIIAH-like family protein [Paenibacillus nanensis]RIX53393.1 SpoIIIAH-like family protein [Paenibacillus nanensis]